ncbi:MULTISPECIES: LLM class F420-dependent oxidoreductase [Streptomyces]|uniref:TIGR03621 family F420-dependent LLM class oxidoreductase n=1 Tax=Streptomyces dengpaensis TaxID=2049881 RepID=A0ABN5ICW5_9ACTN|nr:MULTISPECIES: LLM class F420-dependent oxidoreductase [Streptomyces]AVH60172.1 TIGR03621 family F420-dependent LLM class oxidoreductase [Streptomyces dengpaensis]PIB03368.1 F420-dependent oxidoreductase [Streptomyces sp. HG99]
MPQPIRPFRFGVNMLTPASADEWRAKCRRAEELGYDVITVADHLGMPAPFPALVAAAEATERPRLGTFVLNTGFWNPALLAREVATTDALTGGRLELGLGTGYVQAEHETAGLPWGSPRERVDHLLRTVEELDRLLGSDAYQPQAAQRPRVPLLIGANGDRMLRLSAEHADIVAFPCARTNTGGALEPLTADEIDERVALYREFAAGRKEPAELNVLIQIVDVTEDRGAAIQPWLSRIPHLSEQQVLDLPIVLVGTSEQIVEQVRAQRERYGFSYLTVLEPNMEAFAPVVAALRGD